MTNWTRAKRLGSIAAALSALLVGAAPAWAEGEIQLKTIVEQEISDPDESGKKITKRIPASKVVPGDIVIYTIEAKNISEKPVENVAIKDPIPEHTTYVMGSAEGTGSAIYFSVDGGTSYADEGKLTVVDASGTVRPAGADDYTHIGWSFQEAISPGETRAVSFRARLD